jgi:hypothetical protein
MTAAALVLMMVAKMVYKRVEKSEWMRVGRLAKHSAARLV